MSNPFSMVGVNTPSNYGGVNSENWRRSANRRGLNKNFEDPSARYGVQSYGDSKMEIFGCASKCNFI